MEEALTGIRSARRTCGDTSGPGQWLCNQHCGFNRLPLKTAKLTTGSGLYIFAYLTQKYITRPCIIRALGSKCNVKYASISSSVARRIQAPNILELKDR